MKFQATEIPDVLLLNPRIFEDDRGFFFESFNRNTFQTQANLNLDFVQDNHSKSSKGVLRGLHYQLNPKAQGKLLRVISGAIYDVAVDIRKSSPYFGKWVAQELSADNKLQLWIPPGFAHGFLTLEDHTEVLYKATDFYSPQHERCISWNDPSINVDWPKHLELILSAKDQLGESLQDADLFE